MTNQRPMPEIARERVKEAFLRWLQENRPELQWGSLEPGEKPPRKPEKRGP